MGIRAPGARRGAAAGRGPRAGRQHSWGTLFAHAARPPGGKGGRKPRFDEDKRELIVKEEGQGASPPRKRWQCKLGSARPRPAVRAPGRL